MTAFKDRPFSGRFGQMGDRAEAVFEEVAERGWERFGLKRPRLKVGDLPARIRHLPDYLQTRRFVEVQGFGPDQMLKVKLLKWDVLQFWNAVHPVVMFVYDSTNDRYTEIGLDRLNQLLNSHGVMGHFDSDKAYMAVPASMIFDS